MLYNVFNLQRLYLNKGDIIMKTSKKYPLNYSIGFVRMILTIKLKGYAEKVEYKESSTDSFVLTFSEHEADIELFAANGGTDLIISAEEGKNRRRTKFIPNC